MNNGRDEGVISLLLLFEELDFLENGTVGFLDHFLSEVGGDVLQDAA